jgi:uncharacterized membrane protein
VGGLIGLAASLVLTVEKIALLKSPDYIPTCSIDPILSCGSIMRTEQAEAFGFPNPLLGITGFAVVLTVGVVLLAGAELPRWFWLGLQAGATFGVVFVHWLIYQSLYVIGALCPYCGSEIRVPPTVSPGKPASLWCQPAAETMWCAAWSICSAVLHRPSDNRSALRPRLAVMPMAMSTGEGWWSPL